MIKGIDIFRKEYILYYLGGFLLAVLVGFTKGWVYLVQYASLLLCLFLPTLLLIQLFVFIRQLANKLQVNVKELVSFITISIVFSLSFYFGLNEKQRTYMLTINIFILSFTFLVLLFLTYKNKKTQKINNN